MAADGNAAAPLADADASVATDFAASGDAPSVGDTSVGGADAATAATQDATVAETASGDLAGAADASEVADAAPLDGAPASDGAAIAADVSASVDGDCPAHALAVYVVTADDQLVSFAPLLAQFKTIATLSCKGETSSPFSMSVDRTGTAWVLYFSGNVYRVNTITGACFPTAFVPDQLGFDVFGMGFSADGPGLASEQLFVAGGGSNGFVDGPNKLAVLNLQTLKLNVIATLKPVASGPDLSGNGNGELWGFFPETTPPSVRQIDKATAATGVEFPLPVPEFSGITSWAFASWGGNFYLFSRNTKQNNSALYRLTAATGQVDKIVNDLGYIVVGAGVSSCAPITTQP